MSVKMKSKVIEYKINCLCVCVHVCVCVCTPVHALNRLSTAINEKLMGS